ncbi:DUF3152 domain-containing protein [Streptomyces jumonjinensis]|uniref:DUF3152 domain-containing protein n=1 Tax=Streptomyces jumonjinensis TaxID=1945 RepID=UPI0037959F6F
MSRRKRASPRKKAFRALTALLCAGTVAWAAHAVRPDSPGPSGPAPAPAPATPDQAERSAPADTVTDDPKPPSPKPRDSPEPPKAPRYQENGPGTYTWAGGTGRRVGSGGRLIRYGVKVEDGTGLDAGKTADEIDGILRDRRGWTRQGAASFQRVGSPPYDMVVQVVSPGTTDRLCGAWGLDTGGEVNCANAPDLVVNVRRWVELSEQYPDRAHDYHALIINHEVGHVLGYGHRGCAGPGRPASAMMQQIKGLKGCVANPWVHDEDGSFIGGPKVP